MDDRLRMRTPHVPTVYIRLHARLIADPQSALFVALVHPSTTRYTLCNPVKQEGRNAPGMKPRILIVDDDSTITQQLYWTLCDEYDVVTANDLQTAIRRATFYKPDISILDLQMPPDRDSPASGLRLLEYIKGHLSNSRVLIMSSNSTSEVRNKCFAAGADGFFAKPFELQDMLASICKLTPVHRLELFAHIL